MNCRWSIVLLGEAHQSQKKSCHILLVAGIHYFVCYFYLVKYVEKVPILGPLDVACTLFSAWSNSGECSSLAPGDGSHKEIQMLKAVLRSPDGDELQIFLSRVIVSILGCLTSYFWLCLDDNNRPAGVGIINQIGLKVVFPELLRRRKHACLRGAWLLILILRVANPLIGLSLAALVHGQRCRCRWYRWSCWP